MAIGCISPLFVQSLIYLLYSKDWGGGYVVKTYPSIYPVVAPPILITFIRVTLITTSVTLVTLACLDYGREYDCPDPPVNMCIISVEKSLVQ